jgi:hypothetical protein
MNSTMYQFTEYQLGIIHTMLEIDPWVQFAYRWYHEMSESTCVNVYDVEDWVIDFYNAYNKIYPGTY